MPDVYKEVARASTRNCFENLRSYLGKRICVERGQYTFCTEEDHPSHFWPPSEVKEVTLILQNVDLENLRISGTTPDGQDCLITFTNSGESGVGYYSIWYITRISYKGQSLFSIEVKQDERPGFTGQFYFRLEKEASI